MKNTIVSHNLTPHTLVVVYSSPTGLKTQSIESSHLNWRGIIKAYKARNFEQVIALSDVRSAINTNFAGTFEVKGNSVYYKGEVVHGYLFERIIYFMREGLPYKHLIAFANNLFANPSARARNELFTFLSHKNMPITEDGCFLAYKGVRADFYSITGGEIKLLQGKTDEAGRIYNAPGQIVECERADVDDDATRTCSKGIHAGSIKYATDFAGSDGVVVIVKINPKDAVAVPTDCNGQKLRTCAYTVLGQETRVLSDKKDIYYDKAAGYVPSSDETDYALGYDQGFEEGWDEGWDEGVKDQSNPVLNDEAETATGPKRDSSGRFTSASTVTAKRDAYGRFTS